MTRNRRHIARLDTAYNALLCTSARNRASWFVGCLFAALTVVAACRNGRLTQPSSLVILFVLATVLYVSMTGTMLDVGENNRFRFSIDPFILILVAVFVADHARAAVRYTGAMRSEPE